MRLLALSAATPDPDVLAEAAHVLRAGGLVAFPTETVYGLGAHALDAAAVQRIFAAKGRPSFNPLIAHVPDVDGARALVREWPEAADRLARAFWPGPLTLVLPKRAHVPDVLTAGLPAVAVRVPSHPVALALLRAVGLPVAAPSANRFTELSPTTAQHVAKALGDRVDLILDGGPTSVGIESTVVDLTGPRPVLLRPGIVSATALAEVLGTTPERPAAPLAGDAPRPAPGMVERHYAPRATVWLFDPHERPAVAARLAREAADARVGALLLAPWDAAPAPALPVPMPDDPAAYARRLYAALHELDDAGCTIALVERPPDTPAWHGVRDRLTRAAH
jgi:L-threonylcarbamoyladenylate synthase